MRFVFHNHHMKKKMHENTTSTSFCPNFKGLLNNKAFVSFNITFSIQLKKFNSIQLKIIQSNYTLLLEFVLKYVLDLTTACLTSIHINNY